MILTFEGEKENCLKKNQKNRWPQETKSIGNHNYYYYYYYYYVKYYVK